MSGQDISPEEKPKRLESQAVADPVKV